MGEKMDGHQYEHECAKLLKKKGFAGVRVTKASGDQGVDIIAYAFGKKYGIQCKYYTSPVGNASVQEAYAGAKFYNCDIAVVLTNTTFTPSAIELSKKTGVLLWPHNSVAIEYPLLFKVIKALGIFMLIIGILAIGGILFFDGIKFRLIQLIEAIAIFIGGLMNIFQCQMPSAGRIAIACYGISFIMNLITSILLRNMGPYKADYLFFLFAAIISYIGIKKIVVYSQ